MYQKWYCHVTDEFFVSHDKAFHEISGPWWRTVALQAALWKANQASRNGEKITVSVIDGEQLKDMRDKHTRNAVPAIIER